MQTHLTVFLPIHQEQLLWIETAGLFFLHILQLEAV